MSKVGIVKHWNEERGFGHIGQEGNPQDIFVHRTCITNGNGLAVGDRVMYDAIYDDRKKKFQAISVRAMGVGAAPGGLPGGLPGGPHGASPGSHMEPSPGHFQSPGHFGHPNPYQQPVPVSNMMQSSPSMMSSPSTPPMMGGYVPPMHHQGSQNFQHIQHQGSQHFVQHQGSQNFMRQPTGGLTNSSPGAFMQQSPNTAYSRAM